MSGNGWKVWLTAWLAVIVFLPVMAWGQIPDQGDDVRRDTCKSALDRIDALETKYPLEHSSLLELKALVNQLYRLPAPPPDLVDFDEYRAHSSRPLRDPMLGRDLYDACQGLKDQPLINALRGICGNQVPVGYQQAQDIIFSALDNRDGEVECVYTGKRIQTHDEPPADIMNIEHSWPQSQGATGDAKCDLHHLFPTDSKTNNLRGSYPFGNVSNPTWEMAGSKFGGNTFEVRKEHRGNVARALFYFAVRYGKRIDQKQENALREWAVQDPVDADEKTRHNRIENYQHNRNPFIDHPEFIQAIADF